MSRMRRFEEPVAIMHDVTMQRYLIFSTSKEESAQTSSLHRLPLPGPGSYPETTKTYTPGSSTLVRGIRTPEVVSAYGPEVATCAPSFPPSRRLNSVILSGSALVGEG